MLLQKTFLFVALLCGATLGAPGPNAGEGAEQGQRPVTFASGLPEREVDPTRARQRCAETLLDTPSAPKSKSQQKTRRPLDSRKNQTW